MLAYKEIKYLTIIILKILVIGEWSFITYLYSLKAKDKTKEK